MENIATVACPENGKFVIQIMRQSSSRGAEERSSGHHIQWSVVSYLVRQIVQMDMAMINSSILLQVKSPFISMRDLLDILLPIYLPLTPRSP